MREVEGLLGHNADMKAMIIRMPFIKGLLVEMDYERFYTDHGVDFIQDIWGKWHSVHEAMIVMTESMYKGVKYFAKTGTSRDWDDYWDRFDRYNHCFGVAKWNFTREEEPVFTRSNYQILQDLALDYEDFRTLANDSIEWADKIIDGDPLYTLCFLGLTADRCTPVSPYAKAVLKDPPC